jgi:hypothetical protein
MQSDKLFQDNTDFSTVWKTGFHGVEKTGKDPGMNDMRWAWVLFVAASLAVLIRLAMWVLPGPAVKHSEQVAAAAEATAVAPVAETPAAAPEEPVWLDEEEERADGFPPPVPVVYVVPPPEPTEHITSPPEDFHLRKTRWGMTIDEVRASEAGELVRESDRGLMYATSTLELPCLVTYSFVRGGLVRARLSFSDPSGQQIPPLSVAQAQRRFLYLREQLRSRYGEPVQKTRQIPRDVSDLQRSVHKQGELAQQYDVEIAEATQRLQKQRAWLEARYARWPNRSEMVARGLAPHERDLRELQEWKQEAIQRAEQSRLNIQKHREADAAQPLVAAMTARWPDARGLHDIELSLDFSTAAPRLDIRYEGTQTLPDLWQLDEL